MPRLRLARQNDPPTLTQVGPTERPQPANTATATPRSMAKDSEYSEKAREFIGKHVEKHMEEDGMKQDRAVAAAMDEARRKGLKVPDEKG